MILAAYLVIGLLLTVYIWWQLDNACPVPVKLDWFDYPIIMVMIAFWPAVAIRMAELKIQSLWKRHLSWRIRCLYQRLSS